MELSRLERALWGSIQFLCCMLLLVIAALTVYTVVMRYVFLAPPFWGDTVSLFANIWLVLLSLALGVRSREHIAMEGLYGLISPWLASALNTLWTLVVLAFGLFLIRYGYEAAVSVPGMFWELGGMSKSVPMMIMPIAGTLTSLAAALVLAEGWRRRREEDRTPRRVNTADLPDTPAPAIDRRIP